MTIPRNDTTNYWSTPDSLLNSNSFNEAISTPTQHLNTLGVGTQPLKFLSPVSSPDGLQIRNTVGQPETGGLFGADREGGRVHLGIDIVAEIGAGVSTAEAGVVVYAGWAKGYGNVVYVNHAGGVQTRYAHLSEISVKEGSVVAQGDLVGLAGKTGNADFPSVEPHVHFEVRKILDTALQDSSLSKAIQNSQSTPVDPLPLILGQSVLQTALRQAPPKNPPPPPKKYPEPQEEKEQEETQTKSDTSLVEEKSVTGQTDETGDLSLKEKILAKLFHFMDGDKNARLSAKEIKQRLTACLEQSGGEITKKSLERILKDQAGLDYLGRGSAAKKLLAALDANEDGKLTTDEVDAMVQSIMQKCDQNGDQIISREEFGEIA